MARRDTTKRSICIDCGVYPQTSNGTRDGLVTYKLRCDSCNRVRFKSKYRYKGFRRNYCELCGFVAEHPCQLDVDHKDGNHRNNCEDNLQTLCANCHRLKTQLNEDYKNKGG